MLWSGFFMLLEELQHLAQADHDEGCSINVSRAENLSKSSPSNKEYKGDGLFILLSHTGICAAVARGGEARGGSAQQQLGLTVSRQAVPRCLAAKYLRCY